MTNHLLLFIPDIPPPTNNSAVRPKILPNQQGKQSKTKPRHSNMSCTFPESVMSGLIWRLVVHHHVEHSDHARETTHTLSIIRPKAGRELLGEIKPLSPCWNQRAFSCLPSVVIYLTSSETRLRDRLECRRCLVRTPVEGCRGRRNLRFPPAEFRELSKVLGYRFRF